MSKIVSLDQLYNPGITNLEANEHQGLDKPVVYLKDVREFIQERDKQLILDASTATMKVTRHWAKLHKQLSVFDYAEHWLKSHAQFPDQPSDIQAMKDLELDDD